MNIVSLFKWVSFIGSIRSVDEIKMDIMMGVFYEEPH